MSLEEAQIISAEIIMKSASGIPFDDTSFITSENIQDYVPSFETIVGVTQSFVREGFEVGVAGGISISITSSVSKFENFFGTKLRASESGGVEAVLEDGSGSYELPLDALPESLRERIVAVSFTPPPDFGPTDFMGP